MYNDHTTPAKRLRRQRSLRVNERTATLLLLLAIIITYALII